MKKFIVKKIGTTVDKITGSKSGIYEYRGFKIFKEYVWYAGSKECKCIKSHYFKPSDGLWLCGGGIYGNTLNDVKEFIDKAMDDDNYVISTYSWPVIEVNVDNHVDPTKIIDKKKFNWKNY